MARSLGGATLTTSFPRRNRSKTKKIPQMPIPHNGSVIFPEFNPAGEKVAELVVSFKKSLVTRMRISLFGDHEGTIGGKLSMHVDPVLGMFKLVRKHGSSDILYFEATSGLPSYRAFNSRFPRFSRPMPIQDLLAISKLMNRSFYESLLKLKWADG